MIVRETQDKNGPNQATLGRLFKGYLASRNNDKSPGQSLPTRWITPGDLAATSGPVVYRLGHSSMLLKLDDAYLLVDPVFSERASPLQWAGPKRFHPVPLLPRALPPLKAVLISHDHYDHLDRGAIELLAANVEHFVVPTGVGSHLVRWGVDRARIIELGWWQAATLGSIRLTATPAQHFSGRGLHDRNKTLWASWVIESDEARLFFSGDGGYFDGFAAIGARFGGFDLTMVETGAYNRLWSHIHMLPEQSLQAHLDLRGAAMMPIHNSTFDLSFHSWYEPLEQASRLASRRGVELVTPVIGAPVNPLAPTGTYAWWRAVDDLGLKLGATPLSSAV